MTKRCTAWHIGGRKRFIECRVCGKFYYSIRSARPGSGTMLASSPTNHLRLLSQSARFLRGGMRASRPTGIKYHLACIRKKQSFLQLCFCILWGFLRQHRTIPALRLKHRSGSCGTASALPKCSIMSGCGTRIVHRGQKPLALCDRCPCFGSLFPPLAALTFAASSIICAFGLAAAAPRSPYRHLELCGIALAFAPQPRHEYF